MPQRSRVLVFSALMVLSGLLADHAPALAQRAAPPARRARTAGPRTQPPPRPEDARLRGLFAKHGRRWTVRWSPDGQRLVSLLGSSTAASSREASETARGFLMENAGLFRLRPDLADLRIASKKSSLGGSHVELQQFVGEVAVENARVDVNLDKKGHVLSVTSSYRLGREVADRMALSREQAAERAIEEFLRTTLVGPHPKGRREAEKARPQLKQLDRGALKLKAEPAVQEIYYATDGTLARSYKVTVKATRPFGIKDFVIDGRSGAVLATRSHVWESEDAQGQVFIPSPVSSLNDHTLVDNGDANSAVPNTNPNPYFTVPLQDLEVPSGGPYTLKGPFAILEDREDPGNTPPTENSPSFNYERNNDNFEDVMLYYHVDRMERYIQSLGFIDVNNRQHSLDASGFDGDDNSRYVGDPVGAGYIAYGQGGVDDAEDAEIVGHEYGHSIQDNSTNGKYPPAGQAGAMGEGFGDYWGVSSYLAESQAAGNDLPCVGDWDATSYSTDNPPCLRRLDTNKTTDDADGEVHDDGEIWSQALWNVLGQLGKTTADRLALQSHFNVPDSPSFKDGADGVLTADLQLFFGSHIPALCQIFKDRKIYADADCPDLPPSTGDQDTLVVLVNFDEAGLTEDPINFAAVQAKIDDINAYLAEVAYAKATLNPTIKGWYKVPGDRAHYYDQTTGNMLVELVDDAIAKILAAEPGFDFTAFERLILITNDDGSGGETRGLREWATTGPWPYALPAALGTKRLSASVHRFDHGASRFTHAIGHHFGLVDLYAHEGVNFPRPYADGWDNMAKDAGGSFNNSHFLTWEKLRPQWLDDADVSWVPRPPADPDPSHHFDQTFPLRLQETDTANKEVIQIGTTAGIASRGDERVSYYVEARKKQGTFDGNIPSDGVLIYYVNEDISQGFGPLRLVDHTPGDDDLTNAAFGIGDSVTNIDGTGLNISVEAPTGGEAYRIHVDYDPPEDQVDAWIHVHDSNWRSADIWIDSPGCNSGTCGFDADNGRTETDRGDKPRVGEVNRAYARIFNHGPGTAHNVRVDFYFSDPYHGIDGGDVDPDTGGNVAFNKHDFVVIDTLPPTDTGVPVFVNWTPDGSLGEHAHACVKVKIQQVFNDTNNSNQASQENIDEFDTTHGSPYAPVVNRFRVANPYDHPILVYLRADNVPVGWTTDVVPPKAYLAVGGSVDAKATIQPPESYPLCSTEFISVSGWYPSGDTLIELGATTAQVNLKSRTQLDIDTSWGRCPRKPGLESSVQSCHALRSHGCTNPPRPYEHITLEYTGPDGKPIYHDVVTDANGCYEDFLVNAQPGVWTVQAEYPGNECAGGTTTGRPRPVFVPPDPSGFPPGGRRLWYSMHLGMGFPVGKFSTAFDPGPSLTFDLERPLTDTWTLTALLGFHYFHGAPEDLYYRNASLNLKRTFPVGVWRGMVELGAGLYRPKGGPNQAGFNLGVGFEYPIHPSLYLEIAGDGHLVDPGGDNRRFMDLRLGLAFRF